MSAEECIIPIFVPHVGCPNNCVFCNQRKISGHIRPADPDFVSESVLNALKVLPAGIKPQVAFYGGSFTAIPIEDQIALLKRAFSFVERGMIDSIRVSTRPDAIDAEILDILQTYCVKTIELGAQSMDREVLIRSGRGHSAEDVFKSSAQIQSRGFRLIIQMMTGLPGDSIEKTVETAKAICTIRPHGVRIYPTVIIRDTALYDLWKSGRYTEHSVADAVDYCASIVPIFERYGINVIRIGLNPTDELSSGDAVGGAYHPALGELVRSRILLDTMRGMLNGANVGRSVTVYAPGNRISQVIGQHRSNIETLKEEYGLSELRVLLSDNGELRITFDDESNLIKEG